MINRPNLQICYIEERTETLIKGIEKLLNEIAAENPPIYDNEYIYKYMRHLGAQLYDQKRLSTSCYG
jgi:cytochrome c peroxidase